MEEQSQKAFDFAAETVKQLIGLSTGIIALTITFSNDLLEAVPAVAKSLLMWGWLSYLASVLFGVWTLMALTGSLEPGTAPDQKKEKEEDENGASPSIRGSNVTVPAGLQVVTFVLGTGLIVFFGIASL